MIEWTKEQLEIAVEVEVKRDCCFFLAMDIPLPRFKRYRIRFNLSPFYCCSPLISLPYAV